MRIELPFATPSQNTYQHWHPYRRSKFRDDCCMAVMQQILSTGHRPTWKQRAPTEPRRCEDLFTTPPAEKRTVVITRYSAGELDKGNLIGGCKALLDALVLMGLIFDDSTKWLEDHYQQKPAPKGAQRMEIEIR